MTRVSNQTNNTDPTSVNSRIFVGNLNTYVVEKESVEQKFRCYGVVVGISMHKGYAFVQFTDPFDARNAVLGEDGRAFAGQVLDVNMVSEPKPHQLSRKRMGNNRATQPSPEIFPYCLRQPPTAPPIKRLRNDLLGSLTPVYLTNGNGAPGILPATTSPILAANGVRSTTGKIPAHALGPVSCNNPDLLICGTCKELFTSLQGLTDHKRFSCRLRFTCRCQDIGPNASAPPTPACSHCNAQCETWWELIHHAEVSHGISIYRHEDNSESESDPTRDRNGSCNSSISSASSLNEETTAVTNGEKKVTDEDTCGQDMTDDQTCSQEGPLKEEDSTAEKLDSMEECK